MWQNLLLFFEALAVVELEDGADAVTAAAEVEEAESEEKEPLDDDDDEEVLDAELEEEETAARFDGASGVSSPPSLSPSPLRARFFPPVHSANCLSPSPAAPPTTSSPSARRRFMASCCSVPSPQQAPIWATCT
jgi:hypothetical protein